MKMHQNATAKSIDSTISQAETQLCHHCSPWLGQGEKTYQAEILVAREGADVWAFVVICDQNLLLQDETLRVCIGIG